MYIIHPTYISLYFISGGEISKTWKNSIQKNVEILKIKYVQLYIYVHLLYGMFDGVAKIVKKKFHLSYVSILMGGYICK